MNVIVVLGCSKVLEGGDKKNYTPKSHAYGRLKKTIEVFNNITSANKIIVCSGGFGQAAKMKKFLMQNDIPDEHILIEPYSKNTIENCIFTYELLEKWFNDIDLTEIFLSVVTDDYHIIRAKKIFEHFISRLNYQVNLQSHASNFLSYIDNPTESEKKQVEQCYLNDAAIFINYLDNSLKQYQDWYPTVRDYSERI